MLFRTQAVLRARRILNVLNKSVDMVGGVFAGMAAMYEVASAVDGEYTSNGKQKLLWSNFRRSAIDSPPSSAVIFALLNAGEATPAEVRSSHFPIPLHAHNSARGLEKLRKEAHWVGLFSIGATLIAPAIVRGPVIQAALVVGSSTFFGAHRGNQPIGKPEVNSETIRPRGI